MSTLWHILALATWGYMLYRLFCWLEARDRKAGERVDAFLTPENRVGLSGSQPGSHPLSPASRIEVLQGQPIVLRHGDVEYPVRDVWEAIEISRLLAELDGLPVVA